MCAPVSRISAETAALITAAASLRLRRQVGAILQHVHAELGGARTPPTASDLNVENVVAAAEKLGVDTELLPGGFVKLSHEGASSYARSSDFAFEQLIPYFVCGDKWLTSTLLAERGLPVPRFAVFDVARYRDARRFFEALGRAVVVKPVRHTSGGAGVTLGIQTAAEFRPAFVRARAFGRDVMVEEQVDGENVRVTILGGRILGAVRRTPAHVIGDGSRSVAMLVEAKNSLWRSGSRANRLLRPIDVDAETRRILRRQGLGLDSVPKPGRRVWLREVSNADQGGEIEDVREVLHADHLELERAAA